MDRSLYIAASEGKVDVLSQHIDQLEIQATTANRNTALHVAVQFGQLQCVEAILEMCPSMLRRVNIRGETPLHVAAKKGFTCIVKVLIDCTKMVEQELESGLGGEAMKMLRATNVDKDTALHMAVRNCHLKKGKYLEVVRLLTVEDREFEHPPNNAKETPLYLAAERGSVGIVAMLLDTCTSPTYGGPGGKTALHAAAFKDSTGQSTKRLLEWKKDLIDQADAYGWIPLHYAAWNGNKEGVKELLAIEKSMVYATTTNKDGLDTALHIAAARGHVAVIKQLLSHNPDCWEMMNSKGQNVLHIAVDMNMESVIKFIVSQSWVPDLINQKDNSGNTPLHLLIASDCKVNELWMHEEADQYAFNDNNMTPVDLVWSNFKEGRMSTFAATCVKDVSFLESGDSGGRNIACNAHDNLAKLEREKRTKEAEIKREVEEKEVEIIREKVETQRRDILDSISFFQTLVIVAALIATITFAAAFTIPGGYQSNKGRDQGMAILARVTAFRTFVITNTIAMVCSVTSIFICIIAFLYAIKSEEKDSKRHTAALFLVLVSMFALMVAFIAATFAVLAHSIALALCTSIIACIPFIVYFSKITKFVSWVIRTPL